MMRSYGDRMTTNIQKIQRMGDRGYILTILLMILFAIVAAVAVAAAALAMFGSGPIEELIEKVMNEYNVSRGLIATGFILVAVMMAALTIALYFANKLFDDLRNSHTPFKPEYARAMKIVSVIVVVAGVFTLNIALICIAVLLYCFAQIFEYGVELQQVSDETL